MTDDDLHRALAAYRVPDVPGDLDARVMARLAPAPSRRPVFAIGALVAAFVIVSALVLSEGEKHVGHHVSNVRETIALGVSTAVAEAGAKLRWQEQGRSVRVEQSSGSVFYRVERGSTFFVETPAGTIEVLGTCFRVEIHPMKVHKQTIIAAGVATALASTTVVAVYEGGVRVVNSHGSVRAAPGDTISVEPGSAPRHGTAVGVASAAAPSALVVENASLRDELATARTTIGRLEQQIAKLEGPTRSISYVEPTAEQLAQWAASCEVHIDTPSVFRATAAKFDAREISEWGLAKSEVPVVERVLADLHERARTEMREIYLAATGNETVADEVTAGAMLSEIFDKALPADSVRARQRLARERAGLDKAPSNLAALPPIERALRLLVRLGADFEHLLGAELTPARARELRKHDNGWPGLQVNDKGCDERSR